MDLPPAAVGEDLQDECWQCSFQLLLETSVFHQQLMEWHQGSRSINKMKTK